MPDVRVWMGRAHRLLAPITQAIGSLHALGKPCILLVPEQFTLQAERELLNRLQLRGFFTIDVLSPSRLSQRVLAAVGEDERMPLSTAGRRMAVGIALERCEKKLQYYRSSAHRRGFTEKISSLIADMKRGGLNPQALRDYATSLPEAMRRMKLLDLATIYETYENTLSGRFGDSEDQLRYLAARLPESGLMIGQHLFVYGFDALSQQLIELLSAAAGLCDSVTVSLLCQPESAPDGELYLPVRQSVDRFGAALRERGLALEKVWLPIAPLPHAPAIRHLDEALFAYPTRKFEGEQSNVFLSQHLSPYEEATLVSRHILRLCAQGMNIERIAVLYPEQNGYAFAVSAALTQSNLPFYTDEKMPASSHALARFLLSALRAMASDYNREDVVAVMKSGYAGLSFDEACLLENYAREFGINRKKWLTPFTYGDEERVARCETLRLRLIAPLAKARAAIVAARDATASLTAVMELLRDVDAYGTLQQEEKALLDAQMLMRAGQNSQVWQTLLELVEQLCAIADGARLPLAHLAERFEIGFSAITLAALPPASHMLHVGTLGHSLSTEMDAVFLLGMNDSVLTRSADSLLTEDERLHTQDATGTFLGMSDSSRTLFARMDVKRAMTLPTHYLFISYAKTDPSGKALRPLDLLATLQTQLFDGLPESPVPADSLPLSAPQALDALSGLLRGYADGAEEQLPPQWRDRLAKLLASPATAAETSRLLQAADYRVQSVPLTPDAARALFNDRTLSVSRLEEFAVCPFRHFVDYGLRPTPLKEWGVKPVDLGVFFHESLQNFADVASRYPGYPNVTPTEVDALAQDAIAPLIQPLLHGPLGENPRSLASFERARRIVHRACATVTQHLAAGNFSLYQAEARFGYADAQSLPPVTLSLQDGTEVTLHGKIDRIDRYDANGNAYLRVIDYKSSRNNIEAAQTWWGLQLQLMLYLDAAVGSVRGATPAGAFYFHVTDPLAAIDTDNEVEAEADIVKQLQMRGVVLADDDVLNAMDQGILPPAIAGARTKGGSIRKDARALDLPQMQALLQHSRQQAAVLAEALYSGDTSIRPVQAGTTDSCQYCDYPNVCGFEVDARGAQARELPEMSLEELKARLDGTYDEAPPPAAPNA